MFVKFTAEEINFTKKALVPFATAKTELIVKVVEKFNSYEGETLAEVHGKELNCLYELIYKFDTENTEMQNNLLELIENLLMGWNGK